MRTSATPICGLKRKVIHISGTVNQFSVVCSSLHVVGIDVMTYFLVGNDIIGTQVTTLIHHHAEEFNAKDAFHRMKTGNNWPRTTYMAPDIDFQQISNMLMGLDFRLQADIVAIMRKDNPDHQEICRLLRESKQECADLHSIVDMIMLTEDEVLSLWEMTKREAANSGTWMHAMLEHHHNGHPVLPKSMQGELDAAKNIIESIGVLETYRTEWCIYASEEDLAGSIDLVLRDPISNMLYLVDWK